MHMHTQHTTRTAHAHAHTLYMHTLHTYTHFTRTRTHTAHAHALHTRTHCTHILHMHCTCTAHALHMHTLCTRTPHTQRYSFASQTVVLLLSFAQKKLSQCVFEHLRIRLVNWLDQTGMSMTNEKLTSD